QSTDKKGQPYPYGVTSISLGPEPAPTTVSIADLLVNPEAYEGLLVSIPNCSIVSGSIPQPPQAFDGFATVSDGTGTFSLKIVPDLLGQAVRVRGNVTSINFRPTGTEYYIQDDTGGIDLFSTTPSDPLDIGTRVEAFGFVSQFNGLTELSLSSVTVLDAGTPPA